MLYALHPGSLFSLRHVTPSSDDWSTYKFGQVDHRDRLCGLVVRLPGYRPRGPDFNSPALPDFVSSGGSGTGSTLPREDK
jgi:hypothetical protein